MDDFDDLEDFEDFDDFEDFECLLPPWPGDDGFSGLGGLGREGFCVGLGREGFCGGLGREGRPPVMICNKEKRKIILIRSLKVWVNKTLPVRKECRHTLTSVFN